MKTSKAIALSLAQRNVVPTDKTIRAVVFDGNHILCHTEATLDTWWASLPAERKAELYEADLEGEIRDQSAETAVVFQSGVCRYCRCTDARACNPPCCWIDAAHTVCSADFCVERYEADNAALYGEVDTLRQAAASEAPPTAEPALKIVAMQEVIDSWDVLIHPRRHRCSSAAGTPGLRIVEVQS